MAFLVLDIGVENTLKTFLKKDFHKEFETIERAAKEKGREVSFYTILEITKRLTIGKNLEFDPKEIMDLHDKRNSLYHDRARFKPLDQDLQKYLGFAKALLKALLDVDIEKSQDPVQNDHSRFSLARIQKNVLSLQSNSSIVVEHLYPQIATRKIEAQLRYIRTNTGPDDESYPPSVRAEFVQQRINAFNKITGWEFTEDDHEFIEYIIDNPEQLHVWLAFQELGDGWREDWKKYEDAVYFIHHEQNTINIAEDKKYEEIYKWTHEKADIVCQWLKSRIPDIEPKDPDRYYPPIIFDP